MRLNNRRLCNYPDCDCPHGFDMCKAPNESSWYRDERESASPTDAKPAYDGVTTHPEFAPQGVQIFCDDPACVICSALDDTVCTGAGYSIAHQDQLDRRAIVQEIRELRQFGSEHPEHVIEVYCRINELLDQLGDDS